MRRRLALAIVASALVLGACGGGDPDADADADAGGGGDGGSVEGTVTVVAATSLTDALTAVAAAFEAAHPAVRVELSFDSSSVLATQIEAGAPADVFLSADLVNLERVVDAGAADGQPVEFASNRLQIVVAEGNPLGITGLADLVAGLRLALCSSAAPCGRYSAAAFDRAGLALPEASEEENVRGVLTKVALGEADAGIVYVTDVLAAEQVEGVDLPSAHQVVATYPAVALADASNPIAGRAFVAFLLEEDAVAILSAYGFGRP